MRARTYDSIVITINLHELADIRMLELPHKVNFAIDMVVSPFHCRLIDKGPVQFVWCKNLHSKCSSGAFVGCFMNCGK